jgi:hypothetical protein
VKEIDLEKLNPGIRATVRFLREHGFNTCDSGDGVTHEFECDLPIPYVHIQCDADKLASEADRLAELMKSVGVNFDDVSDPQDDPDAAMHDPNIEATYLPLGSREGFIHLFNVVLTEEGRAA